MILVIISISISDSSIGWVVTLLPLIHGWVRGGHATSCGNVVGGGRLYVPNDILYIYRNVFFNRNDHE